jgi:hypothetical protein
VSTTANPYLLAHGSHPNPEDGRCAMEWVSYLAGEVHSDKPVCVSPFLREMGIALNDRWDEETRQKLRPYLARMIGTAGDGRDPERRQMVVDWLARFATPKYLDLAGRHETAERLRQLPDGLSIENLRRVLEEAKTEAQAARTEARAKFPAAAYAAAYAAYAAAAYAAAYDAYAYAYAAVAAAPSLDELRKRCCDAAMERLLPVRDEVNRSMLELLGRMLPTEPIQIPVAEDHALVCALP